jgi:transposase-like protein
VAAAPIGVVTDKAKAYPGVIDEFAPQAFDNTTKYANNRVECDHGRLKARLRPIRGMVTDHNRKSTGSHAAVRTR